MMLRSSSTASIIRSASTSPTATGNRTERVVVERAGGRIRLAVAPLIGGDENRGVRVRIRLPAIHAGLMVNAPTANAYATFQVMRDQRRSDPDRLAVPIPERALDPSSLERLRYLGQDILEDVALDRAHEHAFRLPEPSSIPPHAAAGHLQTPPAAPRRHRGSLGRPRGSRASPRPGRPPMRSAR